jgi:hypothetical protein
VSRTDEWDALELEGLRNGFVGLIPGATDQERRTGKETILPHFHDVAHLGFEGNT